jgi:hypothetical protein
VYFAEDLEAFSIDPTGGVIHKRTTTDKNPPFTFKIVPTVINNVTYDVPTAGGNSHTVTAGDVLLLEPDAFSTPSDLISFTTTRGQSIMQFRFGERLFVDKHGDVYRRGFG